MTDQKVPRIDVYVYALYLADGVTPFYIGIGVRQRWLMHERQAWKFHTHKDRIIRGMRTAGYTEIPKKKLAEGLTRSEAIAMEMRLIAEIGRWPNGPLANLTAGGEGVLNPSSSTRAKMRIAMLGKKKSPEHIAKMSAYRKGRPLSPEHAEKIRKIGRFNKGKTHAKEQNIATRILRRTEALAGTKPTKSGATGVYWTASGWSVRIKRNGHRVRLGSFPTKEEASEVYRKAAIEHLEALKNAAETGVYIEAEKGPDALSVGRTRQAQAMKRVWARKRAAKSEGRAEITF